MKAKEEKKEITDEDYAEMFMGVSSEALNIELKRGRTMKRDEILAMEADVFLDRLIQEIIFEENPEEGYEYYSRSMSEAWKVVDYMQGRYSFEIRAQGSYLNPESEIEVRFGGFNLDYIKDKSAPLAICKSALITVIEDKFK